MDKNAIKTFAVESRRQLIESVKYQASLIGITSEGISEPVSKAEGMETYDYGAGTYSIYDEDIRKRESLVREITNKGFDNVVEEVAYTWFNRIIAIRFMEVNDYLPTRTRVLSSEIENKLEPDIITDALNLDLDFNIDDKNLILKLKDENKLNELFIVLFIKQCNKLNEILPGLFEKTDDYMELLLNISFTNEEGIIRKLIDFIPEEDFGNQVEIIGWLYQFYNSELKDETFKNIKKTKVSKTRIPAVTQLFTPDWIVKFMAENSLGKLWMEGHPNSNIKSNWNYYVEDCVQENEVNDFLSGIGKDIKPSDIKIIDTCMGSGHILVYIFDMLMQIYISEGYTEKDATVSIIKNNIYGLDIDNRAYQLAYFALMMKAREYNRNFFSMNIVPSVYPIYESNLLNNELIEYIINNYPHVERDFKYLINVFNNANIYGSLLKITPFDFHQILTVIDEILDNIESNLTYFKFIDELKFLKKLIKQSEVLCQKYDLFITNPPYMTNKTMCDELHQYTKTNYPFSKLDLFSVFIERGFDMIKPNGFNCLVTMQSWMFLTGFKKFRNNILDNYIITNLLHMENMVMGIAFGTSATVFRKCRLPNFRGAYNHIKLENMSNEGCPYEFPVMENNNNFISFNQFNKIPGNPIAYWVDENIINAFNSKNLQAFSEIKGGLATADNKRFLKFWYEVDKNTIGFNFSSCDEAKHSNYKWFPCNKGGKFRKWYGNHEYVINWENDGHEIKKFKKSVVKNTKYYFAPNISWSTVTSGNTAFRFYPKGFVLDHAAGGIYLDNYYFNLILGFLNSNVSKYLLQFISPTLNYEVGHISSLPIIYDEKYLDKINNLVNENIEIVRLDWDNNETSWNFSSHPFLEFNKEVNLISIFKSWEDYKKNQFNKLIDNETELNIIFSKLYSVNIDCSINKVSIFKADYVNDVKSFISYAVGCMFGRYDIDKRGLQYAGGHFNNDLYRFPVDDDNIIPVLDTEYFEDDIVGRFVEFVKLCFGEEKLEKNLGFIAGALKKKGKTNSEIIRNYLLQDFFKDHSKMYKKCPIYWQFDSGKQNAFKCLIYMHRYDSSIIARVRTDYLHKTQKAIELNLAHCDNIIANSSNKSEVSKATKDKNKYIKQLDEIKVYDEALRHMASQNIEIDLDDGVNVNYAKFQNVEISIEGEKNKKIDLLKKIR